jgi:hypothetical protein
MSVKSVVQRTRHIGQFLIIERSRHQIGQLLARDRIMRAVC